MRRFALNSDSNISSSTETASPFNNNLPLLGNERTLILASGSPSLSVYPKSLIEIVVVTSSDVWMVLLAPLGGRFGTKESATKIVDPTGPSPLKTNTKSPASLIANEALD